MSEQPEGSPSPDPDTPEPGAPVASGWRARFRQWRKARPFWAGLWTLLGGLVIVGIPLSDPPALLNSGQSGFTAVLPGLVLVIAGLYVWLSPANRSLAGVLAVTFSVASLVLSNFGGLVVGMSLGILGGAMALGWTDRPRRSRGREQAVVLVLVGSVLTAVVTLQATPGGAQQDESCGASSSGGLLGSVTSCLSEVEDVATDAEGLVEGTTDGVEGATTLAALLEGVTADTAVSSLTSDVGVDGTTPLASVVEGLAGTVDLALLAERLPADTTVAELVDVTPDDLALGRLGELLEGGSLPDFLQDLLDTVDAVPNADDGPDPVETIQDLLSPQGPATEEPEPAPRTTAANDTTVAAAGHDEGHVAPVLRSVLLIPDLDVTEFSYDGIVEHTTRDGPLEVLRFVIGTIDAKGLTIEVPTTVDDNFHLGHAEGTSIVGTGVVLDCTEITITLQEAGAAGLALPLPTGVPLTFRADEPNHPVLLALAAAPPLDLTVTDVDIDLVTLSAGTLEIPQPRAVVR